MSFRSRVSEEKGLAGVLFIFISIWAFSALGMLLGIYYTARNIESNVEFITRDVGEIKGETTLAALLVETNRLADEIKGKVVNLSPILDQVIPLATHIKENLDVVTPIALRIGDQIQGVAGTVQSITNSAGTIAGQLATIDNQAKEINNLAKNIGNNVTDAANRAGSIGKAVDRATAQAVTITGLLEEVYNQHVHPAKIMVGTPGANQKLPDGSLTIKGYADDINRLAQGNGCIFLPTGCGPSVSSPFSRGSLLR